MKPRWLPDWEKDLHKYPNSTEKLRLEWAWQFLRRNPEYQKMWAQLIKPHYKRAHCKRACDAQTETGPIGSSQIGVRFGLRKLIIS
jgi:Family of unknown function (DUF6499)